MKIGIIGAGIIGCTTAYTLVRQGNEVHLLDKAPGPGLETSHANGAQLSYSYVQPLASPQTLRSLPAMLLSPRSPLRWRPSADPAAMAWQWEFLKACNSARVAHGTKTLLALASLSRNTLANWMTEEGWEAGHCVHGKLVICTSAARWQAQQEQVELQKGLGSPQALCTPAECVALEPALTHYVQQIHGGIWTADEAVVDPYRLCNAITASFQRRGGQVHWHCEAKPLAPNQGDTSVQLETSKGKMAFDRLILAGGPWSTAWARRSGISLPVQPIKGYSLTLQVRPGKLSPRCSVTDLGLKTVFAPLGDKLRVAAMAELVGDDRSISQRRLDQIVDAVERVYPGMCDYSNPSPWVGLRPATPDSLPIIQESNRRNVYVNVGHGALGLTLAAGSAQRMANLLR